MRGQPTHLEGLQVYLRLWIYLVDQSAKDEARLQQEIEIFNLGIIGGFGGLSLWRLCILVFNNLEKNLRNVPDWPASTLTDSTQARTAASLS